MKKIFIIFFLLFYSLQFKAQVLNVPEVIQEQNQWCWAGSSNCILKYYGNNYEQCDLAEWVRSVCTWHSFGTTDCCVDPSQGCNYWNYNYGYAGSIEDILEHFGSIANTGYAYALSQTEVGAELSLNRPFVIRWGWYSGGGHFIVGHGINGNTMYYMDPWMGEGLKISTYAWVVDNSVHYWSHTNRMEVSGVEDNSTQEINPTVFPNPSDGQITLNAVFPAGTLVKIRIQDITGKTVLPEMNYEKGMTVLLPENGVWLIRYQSKDNSYTEKIVVCQ